MRFAILVALTLLCLVVQTSVLGGWGPPRLWPDLPLVFVLTWGLAFGGAQGLLAAALAGTLLDSTSAVPFGTHLLALAPAVLLGAARETDLFANQAFLPLLLAPLATLGYYFLFALGLELAGWPVNWGHTLLALGGGVILNAAASPFLFLLTSAVYRRYGHERRATRYEL